METAYLDQYQKAMTVGSRMTAALKDGSLSVREVNEDMTSVLKRKGDAVEGIPLFGSVLPTQDHLLERLDLLKAGVSTIDPRMYTMTKDVLSTMGGTQLATIRTDILPHMITGFNTRFPFFDDLPKQDANGLSETWILNSAPGTTNAAFVDDLGTVTADVSTFNLMQSLVPIGLALRGATFRTQMAQTAGGRDYDGLTAVGRELKNGMIGLATLYQTGALQGETVQAGKTGADEYGTYSQFGINGLRGVVGKPGAVFNNYYPNSGTNISVAVATSSFEDAFQNAVAQQVDKGIDPTDLAIYCSGNFHRKLAKEAGAIVRINQDSANGTSYGANVASILAGGCDIPLTIIPGPSIGSYTPTSGAYNGVLVEDAYILPKSESYFACLGPHSPWVVEVPMGVAGDLTKRYLVAWLAVPAWQFPAGIAKIQNAYA